MKTLVVSDLHFDRHRDGGERFLGALDDADLLICAGDLDESMGVFKSLDKLCAKYPQVIFVAGNHDFYGANIPNFRIDLQAYADTKPNLHYLHNSVCEIGGQRFAGTTLWVREVPNIRRFEAQINDYRLVIGPRSDIYDENRAALAFLDREVDDKTIVITHHMPSRKCVEPRYKDSSLNAFFVCEMGELIWERQPPVWIHGHGHRSVDLMVGKTKILANPLGYMDQPGDINPDFGNLILEI